MNHADLSWSDVEDLTARLAASLPGCAGGDAGPTSFDRVIGVARGGLIPAALLATLLDVKCVQTIQVRLYEGKQRLESPQVTGTQPSAAGPSGDPRRTVLVDEMLDSGRTLELLRSIYPEACFAVLLGRHAAPGGQVLGGLIAHLPPSGPLGTKGAEEEGAAAESMGIDAHRTGTHRSRRPVWVAESVSSEDWVLFPWSPPEDRAEGA